MTIRLFPQHYDEDAVTTCGNCEAKATAGALGPILDPSERLCSGDPLPAGECIECGSLSYVGARENKENKPTNFDIPESLEVIWDTLNEFDDSQKTWPDDSYRFINGEKQRDDVCTAMAWITEALGLEVSTADDSTNGEYVERLGR